MKEVKPNWLMLASGMNTTADWKVYVYRTKNPVLPRDTVFCIQGWDPAGSEIERYESLEESRKQVIELIRQKADQKDTGFLHINIGSHKAIIEKALTGPMTDKNDC